MKNILFLLFLLLPIYNQAQIITTIAGNGSLGYTGDYGPAVSAKIYNPNQIVVDNSGNVYIDDQCNMVIRKVNTTGIITTIAGNGYHACPSGGGGFLGDGGPATNAEFRSPFAVTVDALGNVYIGDDNDEVRKVNTVGIINKFAGHGYHTTDAPFNGEGGQATDAELIYPLGLAVDNIGNIFFIDGNNTQIRKVSTSGIISTVAGNGIYGYTGDGGPATNAELNNPNQIAVDNFGNVYIADGNNVIRKVNSSGVITTFAGSSLVGYSGDGGPATNAKFWGASGVAVDGSNNVYIADKANNVVRKVDATGIISTFAGNGYGFGGWGGGYSGDHGAASAAELFTPTCVATDALGNVYISDYTNNVIRKVDVHQTPITGIDSICVGATTTLSDVSSGGTWSSSATPIATVTSGAGFVTGISAGVAIITHATLSGFKIIAIAVNPIPNLSSTLFPSSICDSALFTYTPTCSISGTSFSWLRNVVSDISNLSATGMDSPDENLYNTSTIPVTVPYLYTLSANSCSDTQSVFVVVNPTPMLSSTLTPSSICDDSMFNYVPTSLTGGTTFSWIRYWNVLFLPHINSGTGNISEVLIDTVSIPETVKYLITLSANGCTNAYPEIVNLLVDTCSAPIPVPVSSLNTNITYCAVNEINIFPNPAQKEIVINTQDRINKVVIMTVVGQTIFSQEYNTLTAQVNISGFPNGIYFVKVNNSEVGKFVKQ